MKTPKLPAPDPEPYKLGYARVSTREQHLNLQLTALRAYGVKDDDIYQEQVSTRKSRRKELERVIGEIREGDIFVVWRLDRIARTVRELLAIIDRIRGAGATLVSLTEKIDLSSPAGKVMVTMIAAMAEFERDLISERTAAGMKHFREAGGQVGRKPKLDAKALARGLKLLNEQGLTKREAGRRLGVSDTTIQNYFMRTADGKRWKLRKR
jgi:DNA invertase Pin-like site-specific DNA recombinase